MLKNENIKIPSASDFRRHIQGTRHYQIVKWLIKDFLKQICNKSECKIII